MLQLLTRSLTSSHKSFTMALPQVHHLQQNDQPGLDKFLDGIASAFTNTYLSRTFITEIDKTPPPYPPSTYNTARVRKHITEGITDGFRSGADLIQAGDFSALAVWESPDYQGVPFQNLMANAGPIRSSWRGIVKDWKERFIGTETADDGTQRFKPFYHLGFLAKNPDLPNVPGSIRAVMEYGLKRAEADGVPAYLEATYTHAVEVYQHFGWRLLETVWVGKGYVNAEGWPEKDGSGVETFAMIYDPHITK